MLPAEDAEALSRKETGCSFHQRLGVSAMIFLFQGDWRKDFWQLL